MRRPSARLGSVLLLAVVSLLPVHVASQTVDLRTLDLPEWTVEEVQRLGSLDGPHDAFVSPGPVEVDPEGRIHVLDVGLPALRIFDEDGRFLRQVGAQGDGPGEYLSPAAFGLRGDSIWVSDARSGRLTVFGPDGGVVATAGPPATGSAEDRVIPIHLFEGREFLALSPPGHLPGPWLPARASSGSTSPSCAWTKTGPGGIRWSRTLQRSPWSLCRAGPSGSASPS